MLHKANSSVFISLLDMGTFCQHSLPLAWKWKLSEVAQLCLTLCDPVNYSPPGSSVHGILQARILEWVAISFSRRSSRPRDRTQVSRIVGRCFNLWATWWVKKVWKEKEHELIGLSFFPILFAIIFEGSNQINNEAAWVRKNMIEFLAGLCSSECHCLLSACEASSGLKKSVAFRGCLCLCLP